MPNNNKKPFQPKIDPDYIPNAPKEVLDKPITALNIYPETQAKLEAVGIKSVFDVAILEMKYLYRIDSMSKKDVFAVMRGLHTLKLDFKKSEKPATPEGTEQASLPKQQDTIKPRPQDNRNNANRNADNRNNNNNNNNQKTDGVKPDRTSQREQRQPAAAPQRERMNTREDFNENGTIKQEREHTNSRDFDRNGKRQNQDNRPSNNNFSNNNSFKSKQQPVKKPPIKLPPLIIEDGLYKFFKTGKWGYKDEKGEVIIEPQFDEAYNFSEGMAGIEFHERVGFINKLGEIVIEAKFDTVCSFIEGVASVTIDNVSWYIDKEGNKQFDLEFESATPFKNGSALVKKEGKWNFIARETGELRPR